MRDDRRHVTDTRVLSAMTHPLRRRLLDLLYVDGPATASVLADRTGEAVGNISHHLKVLAGADLVEEAPELARDRRERWWRRVADTLSWTSTDFDEDAASRATAAAASSLNLDHHVGFARSWLDHQHDAPAEWRDAAFSTNVWLRLTPAELAELGAEILATIRRWDDRADGRRDDRSEDGQPREPVFVFAWGMPGRP